jgi:hypothetical protein
MCIQLLQSTCQSLKFRHLSTKRGVSPQCCQLALLIGLPEKSGYGELIFTIEIYQLFADTILNIMQRNTENSFDAKVRHIYLNTL